VEGIGVRRAPTRGPTPPNTAPAPTRTLCFPSSFLENPGRPRGALYLSPRQDAPPSTAPAPTRTVCFPSSLLENPHVAEYSLGTTGIVSTDEEADQASGVNGIGEVGDDQLLVDVEAEE